MPEGGTLGMSESELREALLDELELAFRTERKVTAHGMAHSIARVIALDNLRLAEQLEREGIRLHGAADRSAT